MKTGAEIEKMEILGGGAALKAEIEPLRADVERLAGMSAHTVGGKVLVQVPTTKGSWKAIYAAAKAVRAGLSADFKVSKPERQAHGGVLNRSVSDSFWVSVR